MQKAAVLDIAMRAYWQDGPAEVSLNAICQRAGVSKPSVYREFGNEDGLTHAALENYAQCVLAQVLGILGGEGSFAARINRVAYLAAEDATHAQGCLFVKMRGVKGRMGETTQALIASMEAMAIEAYAKALTEARETGDWDGSVPVPLAAQYLYEQVALALDQRARGQDPKAMLALALTALGVTQ